MDRLTPEPDEFESVPCSICEGTGVITTPARVDGGVLVEECESPCVCQKRDDDEYDGMIIR